MSNLIVPRIDISSLCLGVEHTLQQVISCIDQGGCGIVLVVDSQMKLLATVTDGDIRRAILSGINLDAGIPDLLRFKANSLYPYPITAPQGISSTEILALMQQHVINQVPLVDETGRVSGLVTINELLTQTQPPLQALVLTGGDTSQLYPLSDNLPRPMLPVGSRPLLEHTVGQLSRSGIRQIYLTTRHKTEKIVQHFGDGHEFGVEITYIDENQSQSYWGQVHSSSEPLLVMNGDILTKVDIRAMLEFHREQRAEITLAVRRHDFQIPYGVVDLENGQVRGLSENPTLQRFINAGIYLINPDALTLLPDGAPFSISALVQQTIGRGGIVASFPIYEYWLNIREYADYQKVQADVRDGVFEALETPFTRMEPGAPVPQGMIPLCVPEVGQRERIYIQECLDTNWVSSVGPFVNRFEEMTAAYVGAKYGVATSSGTAALHTALLAGGVRPNEEVLVSTLTFIAPANAIRYAGAWPVFIDADPDYWQMDPNRVEEFIQKGCERRADGLFNRHTGRRVSSIMPVHILGHPCDMDSILAIARRENLLVIEDATESLGAKYKDLHTGHLGHLACFSYNGNKIITTGGGGMVVTDNEEYARRARYLTTQAKDDPLEFVHGEVGYNYRLTNIQAAMGCAQMEKLPDYLAAKRRIAERYTAALTHIPGLTPMHEAPWAQSAWWLYTILVDEAVYGLSSRILMRKMETAGVQCRPLWQPIHLSPAHSWGHSAYCPVAERLNRMALSLPCSVGLNESQQERVIALLMGNA